MIKIHYLLILLLAGLLIIVASTVFFKQNKNMTKEEFIIAAENFLKREGPFDKNVYNRINVVSEENSPGKTRVTFTADIIYLEQNEKAYRSLDVEIDGKKSPSFGGRVESNTDDSGFGKYFVMTKNAESAIDFVDRSLKMYGNMEPTADVSQGLKVLKEQFEITIKDAPDVYYISLTPHSGVGHFLHLTIEKNSGKILPPLVGELDRN